MEIQCDEVSRHASCLATATQRSQSSPVVIRGSLDRRQPFGFNSFLSALALVGSLAFALGIAAHAQSGPSSEGAATSASSIAPETKSEPKEIPGRIGIGFKLSLLGGGFEVATPVTHRSNVRAGFNMISYGRNFDDNGISYKGQIGFKTLEAHYDFFPFAGKFHISPGILTYLGDPFTATASVPADQSFTLGDTTYYGDPSGQTGGKGKISFNRVAPMATVGWGNLLSRSHKRFSIPFEVGVAFQGSPKTTLALTGNVCDSPGVGCRPVSDPNVQRDIQAQQTKLNNDMSFFKVYPIISVGIGYKF